MSQIKVGDNIINEVIIPAQPEMGFNFPFKIYIPEDMPDTSEVFFKCNLTLDYTSDYKTLDEIQGATLKEGIKGCSNLDPVDLHLLYDLKFPMILPAIPRGRDFRPHFLGKKLYELNELGNNIHVSKDEQILDIKKYYKLDEQEKNMIQFALEYLKSIGKDVSDKVVLSGYSEGSKWASRLALLHPEVVKGVVAGGTGGLMSMPIVEEDGYVFNYPNGIADLKEKKIFNEDEYKKIAFFYYMGENDTADPAMPYFDRTTAGRDECNNLTPKKDENGNPIFILDANGNYKSNNPNIYSDEEVNIINKVLGTNIQKRFCKQIEIFNKCGLNVTCNMYEGNHRTIFDKSEELCGDIDYFMDNNLNKRETLGTK